jgi:hypothetical protein
MKTLFTVTCTLEFEMAVMAETEQEARRVARENLREESENYSVQDWDLSEKLGNHIDTHGQGYIPYGGDGDETVEQITKRLGLETPRERFEKQLARSGVRDGQ